MLKKDFSKYIPQQHLSEHDPTYIACFFLYHLDHLLLLLMFDVDASLVDELSHHEPGS